MPDLLRELKEIGLGVKEATVYLAILELGQDTVQNIAQKANINRATTYVALESLMKKGLVSTFEQGKKTLFIAENPQALQNIILEQEESLHKIDLKLDEIMPRLNTFYNLHPDKPSVRFFEGKEGLKEMQRDFLVSGEKEAVEFFSLPDLNKTFTKEEASEMGKMRRKKGIKVKIIHSDTETTGKPSEEREIGIHEDNLTVSVRLPEDEFPFSSDIIVYGDKTWLASLKGNLSGVIIENKEIADTLRAIFELSFDQFKKNDP